MASAKRLPMGEMLAGSDVDLDDMDEGDDMPEAGGSGLDLTRDFFAKGKKGDYAGAWEALVAAVALAQDEG